MKKIRSSISRPHRTQFPLVHINIHNRQVSPSHLYNYLSRTQSHTFPAHARMDVAMETLCKRRKKVVQTQAYSSNSSSGVPTIQRDRLRLNQHIRTQPTTRRRRRTLTHSHKHTHMITSAYTQTKSLTYASCAFSEQLIVIEEKSRVRVSF